MPLIRKPAQPSAHSRPDEADVLNGIRSASTDERWIAARAAADIPSSTAELAAALRAETDSRVREAMFTSLVRIGTAQSVSEILPMLRSDDAALRTGALDALRSSVGALRELLPQLLSDPDVDVRILSCELGRSLPGEEATRMLCSMLVREREINVCGAAIEVLAEVGTQEALPVLARCAARFPDAPFLDFAIKVATNRINSQSADNRA